MNTTTYRYRFATVAVALVGLISSAAPALASEAGPPQIKIVASGSDLATERGVATVTAHARLAAKRVCYIEASRNLADIARQRQCFVRAVADANRQIALLHIAQMAARSNGIKTASAVK